MGFDGTGADVKAAGNFLVAETFGDVGQDLALAIREIGRVGSLPCAANQLVQGHAGNVGAEIRLPGVDRLYGLHEFLRGCLLEDVAVGARLGAPQHKLGVGVRGQHQHFDLRQFLLQDFGDGQAGHVRHVDVGQ